MDHIYVVGGNSPPYKVGYTANVHNRVRELQTASYQPLRLIATAETKRAREHEKHVHYLLSGFQMTGEWFNCDVDRILSAFRETGLLPEVHILDAAEGWMPPEAFLRWQDEMKDPPFFADDAQCAKLLGISPNSVVAMKRNGADTRTALACRALLHRLEPYA